MEEVSRSLDQLWFKARDYCDSPNNPSVKRILDETKAIYNDAKQKKDPDHLIIRIRNLKRAFESFKNDDSVYDFKHSDDLIDRCDDIEKQLRKLA